MLIWNSWKEEKPMKILFTILSILILTDVAMARTTCRENWNGDMICTDTSGSRTTIREDWNGDTIIQDNRGNRTRCREDWAGNIVCN
jgi:hypothetical protein